MSREAEPDMAPATCQLAVERRTTIEMGPFRLVRERRAFVVPQGWAEVPVRRTDRRLIGAAGALGVVMSAAALGLAAPTIGAPAPFRLIVPIPASVPAASAPAPHARPTLHRRTYPATPASEPRPAATGSAEPDQLAPTGSADEAVADVPSRSDAIRRALLSGDMQEWREPTGHGFVVAGPVDQTGVSSCRNLAVLTRIAGSDDRVEQRRECLR